MPKEWWPCRYNKTGLKFIDMGKQLKEINLNLQDFIEKQKMFFVGTAACEGKVNISPKGMDSFRVLGPNKVIWLNLTGSGNETAAHLLQNERMTIMFCAFEGLPMILRLYGEAKAFHPRDKKFQEYSSHFNRDFGARQIIEMHVDMVQTSCGFAVPLMDYKEDREKLTTWANHKGEEGVKQYWADKNTLSLDGLPTQILED